MKKQIVKRSLCLLLISAMLISALPFSVFAAGKDLPQTGIILFDDFEAYSAGELIGRVQDNNGPWTRRNAYANGDTKNKYWEINWTPYDSADHLLFELGAAGYNQTQINSGQLLYEYDLYYPDAGTLEDNVKVGHYIVTYSSDWDIVNANVERAYIVFSQYKGNQAEIWFPTTSVGSTQTLPLENSQVLSFDKWHRISHLIDYDNGIVNHYVDGKYIDSFAGGADNVKKYYHFTEADIYINAANLTSSTPNVYMDNVKIERLSGREDFSVSVKEVGEDYVDLSFSRTADLSVLSKEDFEVKVFAGESLGSPDRISADGMSLRLHYREIPAYQSYELYINQEIIETINNKNSIPAGTKLSFNTGFETTSTTLLDEDFESVTWPGTNEDAAFAEVYQSYMPEESTENPSVYGETETWQYKKAENEGAFLKQITHNGSTMLHIDHNAEMSLAEGGLDILFPLSKPVSRGVLDISFDVLKNGSASQHLSFGLHDTNYTGTVSFDPMTSWSGSTLFGGYTYWSGRQHCIVTNYRDNRTQIPDGYANSRNTTNKPGTGTWTDVASGALITNNYSTVEALTDNVVHSWRFVIDLDNRSYDVYLDGALKKTMNYIPGGGENGVYDAFTINLMQNSNNSKIDASTSRNVLLDNVKVVVEEPVATVSGVSFEKYDGTQYGHSSTLDAGTEKAIITFSKEMDEDSFDHITVTDVKNTTYTVIKEGNTAVIDFTNCLYPNTEYTISIGSGVADMNGGTLGKDMVLSFTSGAGEYRVDDPILDSDGKRLYVIGNITKGQNLTAKTCILNTTREPVEAHLFVSAYKAGCLTGIKQKHLSLTTDFKNDIEINFTADDGFVGADEIKLILVNNLTDLQPMKNVTVLSNDAIASVDLTSAAPVGELMTVKTQAMVTPAVTTVGGRTGWELDPEEINKSYIRVDVDDSFLYNLKPEDTATIFVDYYDNSYSGFSILYNDRNGELHNQFVQFESGKGTGAWKTATFTLFDAAFDESNVLYGDDFRIITNDAEFATDEKVFMGEAFDPVIISRISVVKNSTKSPFDIGVKTGKTGNIFFDDDPITFNIDLTDVSTTQGYTAGKINYTVYTFDGQRLYNDSLDFTDNKCSFTLEDVPFGAYELELVVEYDDVYQTKLVDFSRSLKAPEVNKQFGTCIHLDSEDYYTQEDAKNILDLVRAAGYGLSRSGGVRWFDVEPNGDGEYVMPEDILFAHRYTHELGIDGQILLGHEHPHYAEHDHPTYIYWLTKPENREAYANYCAFVVDELSDYVEYFGISGEFNLHGPGGWHPFDAYWSNHNPDNYIHYYNLVKDSYEAIRAANPDAVMINGIVGRYEDEWIQECFDLGIMDYSDGFAMDIYDFVARPEYKDTLATPISQFNEQVKSQYPDKQAWITETGWPTREVPFSHYMEVAMSTEEEQARWYARAMAMYSDKSKIDKFMFYAFVNNNTGYFWQEYNFGIIRSHDYHTPFAAKPAFISTAAFNTIVGPATFYGDQDTSSEGYYDYKFVNSAGEEIMMVWRQEIAAARQYTYRSNKPYLEIYDMYGNKTVVENTTGSYTLSYEANPVYIKGVNSIR